MSGTYTASIEAFARTLGSSEDSVASSVSGSVTTPSALVSAVTDPPQVVPLNSISIDSRGTDDSYVAELIIGNLSASVVRKGEDVYLKANDEFAQRLLLPRMVTSWLHLKVSDQRAKDFITLTSPVGLIGLVLKNPDPSVAYTTGSITTVSEGTGVQVLLTENNLLVGTAVVASRGVPWPLRVRIADSTGSVDFTMKDWNVEVVPPKIDSTFNVTEGQPAPATG
ncbi:hypothetical protein EH165_12490 [Nakamurella antarctica]|uniref:Lipoprotein LprG n=1 Tax=Nakamurella antarctica TaxID=1902245 RepID=A0A3G8ZWJ7_9ACTN|nr:hypothetical protein [Nakamurella antarctica]AZI58834.1 hypothetical protein EH165_12490 [Nakamurella antarctica]